MGRFINADDSGVLFVNQKGLANKNLFAYCLNNPIMLSDDTGYMPFLAITAIVGAVVGAVAGGIIAHNTGGSVWAGIGIGAGGGALLGLGLGAAAGAVFAGSATASTTAVATGAGICGEAIVTGSKMAAEKLSNITVLGKYPGYLETAEQLKARVFSVPTAVWDKLSRAEQWTMNQSFLNQSITKGHEFILSTNAYNAVDGTFFHSEIQYLLNNGYRLVDEGWRLIR